jgi:2-oxoglutarate dehydrogenase complex dehydrogenase (E1) component-like enzyme
VLGLETATIRQIMERLRATYCGPIGVEFMHIQDPEQKSWIQQRIEGAPWTTAFDVAEKRKILGQLTEAEGFESFCAKKFVGTKRFGLEGGESTIPAVQTVIETCARDGVEEIAIGMAHRGRLNVLVNVVKKPFAKVFAEFMGVAANPDDVQGSGDVKYHLGTSTDIEIGGRQVHLSLQPNPSHLEAVNPVVVGKVRARQDMRGDIKGRRSVMGILLHGDAAFAGQGVVYETMAMSQLIGYRTGGTVHIVTNNQIGFTTVPAHAYSGLYCTDVAKAIQAPILHVNGDDPEAVVWCARLCAEFRMKFQSDIVLDIVCYRRHGHNESDEPAFTQPTMYARIKQMKTTRTFYASAWRRRAASRPRRRRRSTTASWRRWRTPSRPPTASSPTRPIGWRATGPASGPPVPRAWETDHATAVGWTRCARSARRWPACRGLQRQPQDHPPAGRQAHRHHLGRGHRLGHRRGAGLRHAAAGRSPRPPVRRGRAARHLLPAPRRAGGPGIAGRIRAAEQHPIRPGEVRGVQLPAL